MKNARFEIKILVLIIIILLLSFSTVVFADSIEIKTDDGKIKVTEKTAKTENNWEYSLRIKNRTGQVIDKVKKTIPCHLKDDVEASGKDDWRVEIENKDTDGDGKEDSTQITWRAIAVGLDPSKATSFHFKTKKEKRDFNKDGVVVRAGGKDYSGVVPVQEKPAKPAEPRGAQGGSLGKASFDASTSFLSFSDDYIIETGFPGDPIIGADVNLPYFEWIGLSPDGNEGIFRISTDNNFVIKKGTDIFLRADMAFLTYIKSDNLFYESLFDISLSGVDPTSPFYDPSLPNIDSPFLKDLDRILNPNSPDYDPESMLYFTFQPDQDFWAITAGFTTSAKATGKDGNFPARHVPEPSTLLLLGSGLAGIFVFGRKSLFKKTRP